MNEQRRQKPGRASRGMSPVRLLLTGSPSELPPERSYEWADREFMRRQARSISDHDGGIGVSWLNNDELERVRAVWLRGEHRPALVGFSPEAWKAIREQEAAIEDRAAEQDKRAKAEEEAWA